MRESEWRECECDENARANERRAEAGPASACERRNGAVKL
jgi:hypothetical protein